MVRAQCELAVLGVVCSEDLARKERIEVVMAAVMILARLVAEVVVFGFGFGFGLIASSGGFSGPA